MDRGAMQESGSVPEPTGQDERMARLGLEPGDYYFSPDGYLVFTAQYHVKRGYCCQSGCRHCPYGYNDKSEKSGTR